LINQSDNILRKASIARPTGFTKKTNNMGTIVIYWWYNRILN